MQIELDAIASFCLTRSLDRGPNSGPGVLLSIILKVSHRCDETLVLGHVVTRRYLHDAYRRFLHGTDGASPRHSEYSASDCRHMGRNDLPGAACKAAPRRPSERTAAAETL